MFLPRAKMPVFCHGQEAFPVSTVCLLLMVFSEQSAERMSRSPCAVLLAWNEHVLG